MRCLFKTEHLGPRLVLAHSGSPNHSKNLLIRALVELAVEDMGITYNVRSKPYFGPFPPVGIAFINSVAC